MYWWPQATLTAKQPRLSQFSLNEKRRPFLEVIVLQRNTQIWWFVAYFVYFACLLLGTRYIVQLYMRTYCTYRAFEHIVHILRTVSSYRACRINVRAFVAGPWCEFPSLHPTKPSAVPCWCIRKLLWLRHAPKADPRSSTACGNSWTCLFCRCVHLIYIYMHI